MADDNKTPEYAGLLLNKISSFGNPLPSFTKQFVFRNLGQKGDVAFSASDFGRSSPALMENGDISSRNAQKDYTEILKEALVNSKAVVECTAERSPDRNIVAHVFASGETPKQAEVTASKLIQTKAAGGYELSKLDCAPVK